jgi:hypothetical protein
VFGADVFVTTRVDDFFHTRNWATTREVRVGSAWRVRLGPWAGAVAYSRTTLIVTAPQAHS